MISKDDLLKISISRFKEAKVLFGAGHYDGAVYLCGYALEVLLKRHICFSLNWNDGYPKENNEFKSLTSFKTHDLEILLRLSGLESKIKKDNNLLADWQIASSWNSEIRYKNIGTITESGAKNVINASKTLLNHINSLNK